jgi:hypothetical protein
MPLRLASDQLAALRHDTRELLQRTSDHEDQCEALVASAEWDVRQAEAALFPAATADANHLRHLLAEHLQRTAAAAATVRRLGVGAHEQHAAIRQLLGNLTEDHHAGAHRPNAVLVVDDYGDVRELIARVLEDAGSSSTRQPTASKR